MAIREVVKIPESVLRRKAHKVTVFDRDFQVLVEDMIETMRAEPGVGLAAPQVNVSLQLIVVEYPEDDQVEDAKPRLYVVANPEIVDRADETEIGIEGCLSVPDLVGEVERAAKVVVKGLNRFGKKQKITAKGWLARIFQHEIDHVNGIVFVDRASRVWKPEAEAPGDEIIAE
jgi:peptide deformylase